MNNFSQVVESIFSITVCFVLLSCGVLWTRAFRRIRAGEPILEYRPRPSVPWTVADVVASIFILFGLQVLGGAVLTRVFGLTPGTQLPEMSSGQQAAFFSISALATILAMACSVSLVWLRTGATREDFGWSFRELLGDVRLGGAAFVMLAPIVYMIQLALANWFESKHPLIELLRGEDGLQFLLLSGISAVLVAPLTEEYFFRLLLQGWLERLSARGITREILSLTPIAPLETPPELDEDSSVPDSSPPTPEFARHWPIVVSSLLFAFAHYSHGPDPIPLFVLAFGLGYIYHRTHRIVPCIVVHLLLNAFSLFVVWMTLTFGDLEAP